ncbi:MATE efflux family protein [Paenibacillus vortex V453]|uniref:Probable multidrug resistance protein NorM n=1 Tax=Paenibacillus vortex V453 TaxID=715225 RepID=A0A2R9SU06_9BACL|nr:MATE family efflux transporter [Paenibacillus vortex]EFU40823.1 MATE efflux family protein [Paenibacillus vortex V453]
MSDHANKSFYRTLYTLAIPIALQSLIMALLNMTDQVMVGQLGDIAIASVGISSKIFSVISVVLAGLAATLSIYTAQYWGKKDTKSISHLLGLSLYLGLSLSILFAIIVFFNPQPLLSLFTTDMLVTGEGGIFLQIGALSYVPIMLTMLYSAILRSTGHVKLPMYVSLCAVMLNIILNYLLIFGHFGFPQLGLAGAAYATVIARLAECLLIIGAVYWFRLPGAVEFKHLFRTSRPLARKFLVTMYPLVLTEFVWVLGEAVYAVIYSRMGVAEMTAMTITFPFQGLMIGLLSGIGAAAGVMVGNKLGEGDHTQAMNYARKLIRVGLVTSFGLGIVVVLLAPMYTRIFQVSVEVKQLSVYVIWVFAAFMWVKVANMIIAGGILQSGGDSKFVFAMESTATWLVGVPLGFMLSFVWKQPLFWVYFFLSLEEVVRFIIGYIRYRSGKWMQNLTVQSDAS